MAVDPYILAIFGPAPSDLNLNDSSRKVSDNVLVLALFVIALVSVLLRIYVRLNIQHFSLKFDDYAMLVALVFVLAMAVEAHIRYCLFSAGNYGLGSHVWSITVQDLVVVIKCVYSLPYVYSSCQTCVKLGILYFYWTIFGTANVDVYFSITFYTALFLTCSYPIILWATMAAACRPLSFYWDQYLGATGGTCIDTNAFFLGLGIVNMFNDIIILVVPATKIVRLQMNNKKKLAVAGVLLLGGFVCVASIVRIYYLALLTTAADQTWAMGPAFVWTQVEPAIGIVSACLPTLAPLFRGLKDRTTGKSSDGLKSGFGNSRSNNKFDSQTRGENGRVAGFGGGFSKLGSRGGKDDDEIQLTNQVVGGYTGEAVSKFSSVNGSSEGDGEMWKNEIIVQTELNQWVVESETVTKMSR